MSKATWFNNITLTQSELDRFWSRVDSSDRSRCWPWIGPRTKGGYGNFYIRYTNMTAHRASWLIAHGSIPEGMVMDHLCRVRECVNPGHLEPVTPKVNTRRSPLIMVTNCPSGHPYDEANTAFQKLSTGSLGRVCKICHRKGSRIWSAKRRAATRRTKAG